MKGKGPSRQVLAMDFATRRRPGGRQVENLLGARISGTFPLVFFWATLIARNRFAHSPAYCKVVPEKWLYLPGGSNDRTVYG
jgi:hypothetical protein